MRNLLFNLLIIGVLAGCVTQSRCDAKFPPSTSSTDKTIIKDSIVMVHDTIIVEGSEFSIFADGVPCPELEYHKTIKKQGVVAVVNISKGEVAINIVVEKQKKRVEVQTHFIETHRDQKTIEVKQPHCEHKATRLDRFCYWVTVLSFIGGALWVGLKLK